MGNIGLFTEARAKWVVRELTKLIQQNAGGGGIGERRLYLPSDDGITFQNTGSTTIGAYQLCRVDSTVMQQGFPIPTCKAVDTTFANTYLVNGPQAVEQNDLGTAQKGPVVKFAYDTGSPAAKAVYGPKPSQGTASLGFPGLLHVIGIHDSTNKIAKGFLTPIVSLLGKASGAISARSGTTPGSGSLEIWVNLSSTLTDAGFADLAIKSLSQTAGTSGAYIGASFRQGEWWFDFEDCA